MPRFQVSSLVTLVNGRDGNGLKVTLTNNDGGQLVLSTAQLRLSALVTGGRIGEKTSAHYIFFLYNTYFLYNITILNLNNTTISYLNNTTISYLNNTTISYL